ncbi:MAG: alpha/beta hydrolase [Acidobacteriota bacterium]|nr:alpha/beta hydrolase [Acidobacteriota bacterium]
MERDVELADVRLRVEVSGPDDGPLALCLHGFPDTPFTFRFLRAALERRGYRVAAPWLRGYAPSSTSSCENYSLSALVDDANALHDALGGDERAVVIGHDWGAAIAYGACARAPEKWRRAVAIAVPPSALFASALFRFDQTRRSWYLWFFQSPFAESVVAANELEFLTRLWQSWSPGYDATDDLARVRDALASDDALRAALSYYRALFAPERDGGALRDATARRPQVPTLYLHGADDGCVGVDVVAGVNDHLADGSRVVFLVDAGHFAHLERPELVWREIDAFLA